MASQRADELEPVSTCGPPQPVCAARCAFCGLGSLLGGFDQRFELVELAGQLARVLFPQVRHARAKSVRGIRRKATRQRPYAVHTFGPGSKQLQDVLCEHHGLDWLVCDQGDT